MNQLPLDQWPSSLNEEVAVLRQETDDLKQDLGIVFEDELDDLDFFKAALLVVSDQSCFALKKYRHCQAPGVGVIVSGKNANELRSALNDALGGLKLTLDSVIWLREDVK